MSAIWQLLSPLLPAPDAVDRRIAFLEGFEPGDPAGRPKLVKGLYGILDVLDGKASALMRFEGIVVAVVALLSKGQVPVAGSLAFFAMLAALVSILFCLLVVAVFWRFLAIAFPSHGLDDMTQELTELRKAIWFRESCYRLAWLIALVGWVLITMLVVRGPA